MRYIVTEIYMEKRLFEAGWERIFGILQRNDLVLGTLMHNCDHVICVINKFWGEYEERGKGGGRGDIMRWHIEDESSNVYDLSLFLDHGWQNDISRNIRFVIIFERRSHTKSRR